jgi:putative flippase GtrA
MNLFFRFAAAGAAGTTVHYIVLILMVTGLAVGPAEAAMMGATCGAISNYFLNQRYSFNRSRSHREAAPRFFLMVATGIILNGGAVHILTLANINYLVAQVIATIGILLFNFFVCKTWIFIKTN